MTERDCLRKGNWTKIKYYPVSVEKLQQASMREAAYLIAPVNIGEDYEYFDLVKPYLDIPEPRKSLEEIKQELDEKFEKLIERTKEKFAYTKECAEKGYNYKFDRIIENFEYAKEHGRFPQPIKWVIGTGTGIDALDGSYLISGGSGGNVVSWSTEFNLKSNSVGYYSIDRDIRFNMTKKPNFVVRFCMDKLLGFKWENK
jgi:hypothetical protein